jgi:hypothetical protein
VRYQGVVHDSVMLDALRGTRAAGPPSPGRAQALHG